MKPYVICHSMSSIDGRIQSKKWGLKNAAKYFEEPAKKIKVDGWIVGRTTMQEFSSPKPKAIPKNTAPVSKIDFVSGDARKPFAIGIDPSGKCHWQKNTVDGDHVIEVLTEKVSLPYLQQLRAANVSYVFAGKREIDLKLALEKLNRLFGIKRLRIDGGGTVNGSFLAAGLIDEVSIIRVPIADGAMGMPSSFDVEEGHTSRIATHFKLKSIQRYDGNCIWERYTAIKG